MEARGQQNQNLRAEFKSVRTVEYPPSRSPFGFGTERSHPKTRVHRRHRKAIKEFPSSTRNPTKSEFTENNRYSFGNTSRKAESHYPHSLSSSHWTTKAQHHDLKRVAYPSRSGCHPPTGDPVWQHALFIDGQVYFPKDLEFCQRMAAAACATGVNHGAQLSLAPVTSPLSPNYDPVSLKYQTKVHESRTSAPSLFSTERVIPSLVELKRELNLTILREQYCRFIEDMRTDHTQREEYDPTKPYYEKPPSLIVEDEEYDPERPWYYRND
eukprot:scaffold2438_cov167-Amphora_coffeaeformis.AAC.1